MDENLEIQKRIAIFIEAIIKVAQGNYDIQIQVSDKKDDLDALATGINMMIDELKNNTNLQSQNKKMQEINEKLILANAEAEKVKNELELHKNNLEKLIHERTIELEEKNMELEEFNNLFVGREFRIKELKDEIAELKNKLANR